MSHSHDHTEDIDLSILEQMGYEERDLKIDGTAKLGVYLTFFITLMMGLAWGVIWLIQPSLAGRPNDDTSFKNLPGKDYPLVQSNATAHRDMVELRDRENKHIKGYGWTDESKSKAYIPVDRAMDLVLEEGLPVAAGARKMNKPKPDPVLSEPADSHGTEPVTEGDSTFPDVESDHPASQIGTPGSGATTGTEGGH